MQRDRNRLSSIWLQHYGWAVNSYSVLSPVAVRQKLLRDQTVKLGSRPTRQPLRLATAVAMTQCVIMRLDKVAIVRVLQDEPKFAEMFMSYILARNARVEEDLVDQLFNSSEKRLARVLLLMAHFGKEGKPEPVIAVRF